MPQEPDSASSSTMVSRGRQGWTKIRPDVLKILGFAAAVGMVLLLVRPFGQTQDGGDQDIASEWNETVRLLGLQPVYPPEEDIYVGDIWASVVDPCEQQARPDREKRTPCQSSFRNSAVRIYHLDLSGAMKTDPKLPVFADTPFRKQGDEYRVQKAEQTQAANPDLRLSLAGFPGVTIDHTERRTGNTSWGFAGFSAGSKASEHDEIKIPTAETYGVSVESAFIALDDFCKNKDTALYCGDEYLRKLMSYVLGDAILKVDGGKYSARLQLQIVVRAFLAREIIVQRTITDANGVTLQVTPTGLMSSAAAARSPPPSVPANVAPPAPQSGGGETAPLTNQFSTALSSGRGRGLNLNEVYQRPVVFGYRPITVAVVPSLPKKHEEVGPK